MNTGSKTRRRKTSVETNLSLFMDRANKIESQRLQKQLESMETTAHKNMVCLFRRRLSAQDVLACLQRQEGDSCLSDRETMTQTQKYSSNSAFNNRSKDNGSDRKTHQNDTGRLRSKSTSVYRIDNTSTAEDGVSENKDTDADTDYVKCLKNLNISTTMPTSPGREICLPHNLALRSTRPKSAPLKWRRNACGVTPISASYDEITSSASKFPQDLINHQCSSSGSKTYKPQMRLPRGARQLKQRCDVTIDTGKLTPTHTVRQSNVSTPQHRQEDFYKNETKLSTDSSQSVDQTNDMQDSLRTDSPRQHHKPRLLSRAEKLGIQPLPRTPGFPIRRARANTNSMLLSIDSSPASTPSSPITSRKPTSRVRKISAMTHTEFMNDSIRSKAYGLDHQDSRIKSLVMLPMRPHTAGGARKLQSALTTSEQNLDRRLQAFLKQPMPGEHHHEDI